MVNTVGFTSSQNRTDAEKAKVAAMSRLFSQQVIKEFSTLGVSALASRALLEVGLDQNFLKKLSLSDLYDEAFSRLIKSYRNEYVYKNALAEKVLLGIHSLNTSHMCTELRIGTCKADVVLFNGSSHVYEIKSEQDSFDRLENQLETYTKAFDLVSVVTTSDKAKKLSNIIPNNIGITALSKNYTLQVCRKPTSNKHNLTPSVIFDTLRRSEYIEVVENYFGPLPELPNAIIYKECKSLFAKLSPELAHDAMVKAHKRRGISSSIRRFIMEMPRSLKAISLSARLTQKERENFIATLRKSAQECMQIA